MDNLLALSLKRLNRSSYILSLLVSMFLFMFIALALDGIVYAISGFELGEGDDAVGIFLVLNLFVWYAYAIYCVVRRFHDHGMSGWWTLAAFVPLLNFILGFKLLFLKGDESRNKHGEPLEGTFILGFGFKL